jgi:hypothetical protein
MQGTQRRTLTPPRPVEHFDHLLSDRAKLRSREQQESQYHNVRSKIDTRRVHNESGTLQERLLHRFMENQQRLSPNRSGHTAPATLTTPPALSARAPGSRHSSHSPASPSFYPDWNASQLLGAGGAEAHFLSSITARRCTATEDSFAALQYAALTADPRRDDEARLEALEKARAASKIKNKLLRKGPQRRVKTTATADASSFLRSPREVPVSAYIATQIKALRYSLRTGGHHYHEDFMQHADNVEATVARNRAARRRAAPVDFVDSNVRAVSGTSGDWLAQRQQRATLVEQRSHVDDAALTDWLAKFRRPNTSPHLHGAQAQASSPAQTDQTSLAQVDEDDGVTLRLKKLLTFVALGRAGATLNGGLDAAYLERSIRLRQRQMQIVNMGGLSLTEVHRSWGLVRRQMRRYVQAFKRRKYNPAVDLVRRFLMQRRRQETIRRSVAIYRGQVVVCQRATRAFLLTVRARRSLLATQWIARESDMLRAKYPLPTAAATRSLLQASNGCPDVQVVQAYPMRLGVYAAGHVLQWRWAVPQGTPVAVRDAELAAVLSTQIRQRVSQLTRYEHRVRFYERQLSNYVALTSKGVEVPEPQCPTRPWRKGILMEGEELAKLIRQCQVRAGRLPERSPSSPATPLTRVASSPGAPASAPADSAVDPSTVAGPHRPPPALKPGKPRARSGSVESDHIGGGSMTKRKRKPPAPPPQNKQVVTGNDRSNLKGRRLSKAFAAVGDDVERRSSTDSTTGNGPVSNQDRSPTSPSRGRGRAPMKPPDVDSSPRGDAFYAKVLGKASVPSMRQFLAKDDRTGTKMMLKYSDTLRPASPVQPRLADIARADAASRLERAEELFRTELIVRSGVKVLEPKDVPGTVPLSVRTMNFVMPLTTLRVDSNTSSPAVGPPQGLEGSPRPPVLPVATPAPPSTCRAVVSRYDGSGGLRSPRNHLDGLRPQTQPARVRLPVVGVSTLAAHDPVPSSRSHVSRRIALQRQASVAAQTARQHSRCPVFDVDVVQSESAMGFLMTKANQHLESLRPTLRH